MPTRSASAEWKGGLKGQGTYKGQTGLAGQYNFTSRFEEGMTGSNPEELLAAADAACFSMALAFALAKAGHEATSVQTTADCSIDQRSRFVDRGVRGTMQRVVVGTAPEPAEGPPAAPAGSSRPTAKSRPSSPAPTPT